MQVKLKGYHEQLTLDEAAKVWVRPVKRHVPQLSPAEGGSANRLEIAEHESM
jgi:hypothetical protein